MLARQHLTMFEDDTVSLSIDGFDHNPTPGWARHRLADHLGIVAVILGRLTIGLKDPGDLVVAHRAAALHIRQWHMAIV